MKSRLETVYLKCPVWAQNALLSLYGYKIHKARYGGNYSGFLKKIRGNLNLDKKQLLEYQAKNLRELIQQAAHNVPYYHHLFNKNHITADSIKTLDDLQKIPILGKDPLRQDPERFINQRYHKKDLNTIYTSGTTGTPLKIYCTSETRQLNYAFYDRFLEQAGINRKGRKVTLGGRTIVPSEQMHPPFWRYSQFQKNLFFSSYHLTEGNIPHYIDKFSKFQPEYIDSYPSSLYVIAKYAAEHNINLKGIIKAITTSAETLFPEQREIIESVFGVPIFDQYGAVEMCVFVSQCKNLNYHIQMDYGIIEYLRNDGTQAKPGEEAEIICTGFINPVMPLIRYHIGDRGIFSDKPCRCGSNFPVMEKILGRMDDIILTPDGRKVGRLGPVIRGFPVKEVQYIQEKVSELIVLIVKDAGFNTFTTERELIKELQKRVGTKIDLKFKYVDKIERSSGGKLRTLISKIGLN